jgi:hypothetical protein
MPSQRKKSPPPPRVSEPSPVPATRLIFEFDGDAITLLSQQSVDVAVTGTDLAQGASTGVYVDARDAADRTLARVHARAALEGHAEVFPEQPGDPIRRVDIERPKGAFTVIVPTPSATKRVAVVRLAAGAVPRDARAASAAGAQQATAPLEATELAAFDLSPRR